jgi:hypothetical protein
MVQPRRRNANAPIKPIQMQPSDPNGTVRQFDYDLLGRLLDDMATTLGSGVDTTVQRISRTYEVRGMVENITSYNNATPGLGTAVNDVELVYDTFQQVEADYQSYSGAVNTSTSPRVAYAYETGGSAAQKLESNPLWFCGARPVSCPSGKAVPQSGCTAVIQT